MTDEISRSQLLQKQIIKGYKPVTENIGGRWLDVSLQELIIGRISDGAALYVSMKELGWNPELLCSSGCEAEEGIPVVAAARVIVVDKIKKTSKKFSDQVSANIKLEGMYSLYYIPAILSSDGSLRPCYRQFPWFDPSFKTEDITAKYQDYVAQRQSLLGKIPDWKTWVSLAFDLYQNVLSKSFTDMEVNGYKLTDRVFIIPDEHSLKTAALSSAYKHIISQQSLSGLANRMLSSNEIEEKKRYYPRGVDYSFSHSAHVDSLIDLPSSHRTVVEQMIRLENGGIIAINSPLGSSPELCVLDTVASKVVNAALLGEKPPLSAILMKDKNDIDVWKKYLKIQCNNSIDEQQEALRLLGFSWISGSGAMSAVITDEYEAKYINHSNNMVTVGICSDLGLSSLDNPQKIKEMTAAVMENCSKYFKETLPSLEKCRTKLHETLVSVDYARQSLLQTGVKLKQFVQADAAGQDLLFYPEDELDHIIDKRSKLHQRLDEWTKHFKAVPLSLRIGANSDLGKIKLKAYYEAFRNDEEIKRIPDIIIFEDVEKGLAAYDHELAAQESVLDEIVRQQDKTERMIRKLGKIGLEIEMMKKYISQPEKINSELDRSLRLLAFWLAVHYYECRWLAGESIVLIHQKSRSEAASASRYLNRLSLLAPIMLAEPDMLLRMRGINKSSLNDLYILNAQNWSLAEALPLFDLTKRVHVLGDPAASADTCFTPLDKKVDITVIPGDSNSLEDNNLDICSNLLEQAADRSAWYISGRNGMWLFENMKNYEEIASYGSMLNFNDKIKAVKGSVPHTIKKAAWLPMSLWQIDSNRAEQVGFDLIQQKEADEIIRWIRTNYDTIKSAYPDTAKNEMAAIVTPFKAQRDLLAWMMEREFKHLGPAEIRVDTIDCFTPGDSYPIVLFSGVYSRTDGCPLYINDQSLLYKSVSLASDAFIYFGDINALPEKDSSSASRLRRKLKPLNRKK